MPSKKWQIKKAHKDILMKNALFNMADEKGHKWLNMRLFNGIPGQ